MYGYINGELYEGAHEMVKRARIVWLPFLAFGCLLGSSASASAPAEFKIPAIWEYSAPLVSPEKRQVEPSLAQKDPSIVFHNGKWHVFMTVKLPGRTAMEYCSFKDWRDADKAPRTLLRVSDSTYACAPQGFYFRRHK